MEGVSVDIKISPESMNDFEDEKNHVLRALNEINSDVQKVRRHLLALSREMKSFLTAHQGFTDVEEGMMCSMEEDSEV